MQGANEKLSGALKAHTPQIWEVKIHPPNLGGESSPPKSLVLQCFWRFFPEIWGVKSPPPKFGGRGLSGGFAAIPGIAPRVALRIVGFVLIKS